MSKPDADLDIVEGSGNVFRDVGLRDRDTRLIKAELAAEIIRVLRTAALSNVAAAERAGVAETDISRIRNAISTASRSTGWYGSSTGSTGGWMW